MKILDFLPKEAVRIGLEATKKKEVVEELVELLVNAGKIKDREKKDIIKALLDREKLGSTGIGQGIAIPHAKSEKLKEILCAFGISKKKVDFNSLDGEPVDIVFLLIAPQESSGLHLKALAKISRLLKDKFFRQSLRDAVSEQDIIKIIRQEDEY